MYSTSFKGFSPKQYKDAGYSLILIYSHAHSNRVDVLIDMAPKNNKIELPHGVRSALFDLYMSHGWPADETFINLSINNAYMQIISPFSEELAIYETFNTTIRFESPVVRTAQVHLFYSLRRQTLRQESPYFQRVLVLLFLI